MRDEGKLRKILTGGKPEPELPLAEEEVEQQDVGPCGMVAAKGCKALDVERGGSHPVVSFQLVYLGVMAEFTPTKFWVVFVGVQSWKVTVEGRNLRPLFDRLNDHCLRRIRQVNRDMLPDDGKPVVTKIEAIDVTQKERD